MTFSLLLLAGVSTTAFAAMIVLALSKKSSFRMRVSALVALALMIVSLIVCVLVLFSVRTAEKGLPVFTDIPPAETTQQAPASGNVWLTFIVFLIAMFLLVLVLSIREQRRAGKRRRKMQEDKAVAEEIGPSSGG